LKRAKTAQPRPTETGNQWKEKTMKMKTKTKTKTAEINPASHDTVGGVKTIADALTKLDGYASSNEVLHEIARQANCDVIDWARGELVGGCNCNHEYGESCKAADCQHAAECYRLWQWPEKHEFRAIAERLLAKHGNDADWEINWGANGWTAATLRAEAGL